MAKPKKVHVTLIPPDGPQPKGDPYRILKRLVASQHRHLADAKIALAWHKGWKTDPEFHLKLGQAKRASDLEREFHNHDFVILLNFNVWDQVDFTPKQIEALLDHALCHCQVALDKDGVPKEDERGRTVWRIRKHDLEEFQEIVGRHGCWKSDLEAFVKAALRRQPSLFADVPPADEDPRRAIDDPKVLKAVENLCPDGKGEITSVTLGVPGGPSATLTPETRKRIRARRKALDK